ncbi:MAG TPA: response regulator transcription factor [Chloroflexota bacterium]|jgi:DNA-binding NarL/FixJ family response regulator
MLVGARLFAEALAVSLQSDSDLHVVSVEPDPLAAIDGVREVEPDVVVLDDATALLDATRLVSLLRKARPEVHVLILATSRNVQIVANYARAGAAGWLAVDQALDELVKSIKQIGAGEPVLAARELIELVTGAQPARSRPSLAPREIEVLQVLASGMSTEEAAAQLGISVHTVRTHLKKAMTKLDARSKVEAIIQALRAGLIHLPL